MIGILSNMDQIWMQLSTIDSVEIRPQIKVTWPWDNFRDWNHKWFALNLWLQSYLVPIVIKIAIIFGPNSYTDCDHIWYLTLKSSQSYVVQRYFSQKYWAGYGFFGHINFSISLATIKLRHDTRWHFSTKGSDKT